MHFSAEPAVAITLAPNALASWIAVVPMPLVPPCTRNHSPAVEPPALEHVVPHREEGLGHGRRRAPCRARPGSAAPPAPRRCVCGVAAAVDQRAHLVADASSASRPRPAPPPRRRPRGPAAASVRAAADRARRAACTSGRLTPAAATLTRIWPGRRLGRRHRLRASARRVRRAWRSRSPSWSRARWPWLRSVALVFARGETCPAARVETRGEPCHASPAPTRPTGEAPWTGTI